MATRIRAVEYDGLALGAPPALAGLVAVNVAFIGLDNAVQQVLAVRICHVLVDFVAHSPCALVRDAQ